MMSPKSFPTPRAALAVAVLTTLAFQAKSYAINGFPDPKTADPVNTYTAAAGVDWDHVLSYTEPFYIPTGVDGDGNPTYTPEIYWFKYTSDGRTAVTFDTLGTNISNNPGGFGTSNETKITIYNSSGQYIAQSGGYTGLDGNPVPINPNQPHTPGNTDWYTPLELTSVSFTPSPPTNPKWHLDPNDPTFYTGWSAPGNEGNGEQYYPPNYYTGLNEYHVWSTALSPIVLDNQGNPWINPNTGTVQSQPGWRFGDYLHTGPASSWNHYSTLPAGTYYLAVTAPNITLAGDQYGNTYLQSPVTFSYDTDTNTNVLAGPLTTWQYYEPADSPYNQYGTLKLNITQHLIGDANLDDTITIADYVALDTAFLLQTPNPTWANGDFNGDGVVNYLDYAALDNAFLEQGGGPLAESMIHDHAMEFGADYLSALSALAPVPEPTSLSLIGVGTALLLKRRRTRA